MKPFFLVLDTSTDICSIGLYQADQLLGLIESRIPNHHASVLPEVFNQVLENASIRYSDIQALAFANGPGSYTGLRIGLASIKAIAWAHQLPLMCYSSLDALAWQIREQAVFHSADICIAMDARRLEVYFALYDAQMNVLSPAQAQVIEDGFLFDYPKKIIFAGNGYPKWLHHFPAPHFIPSGISTHNCSGIGTLLLQKWNNQEFTDWETLEPHYIKEVHITRKKI